MIEIIVVLIAVFGAVLPYLLQKNKELNLKIAEQKREAYASFLKNFTEIAVAVMHDEDVSGKDADMERMLARDQLLLYGSDDVIEAYDAWVRYADTEKHDLDKEGELVSLIFLAIRKDLLATTQEGEIPVFMQPLDGNSSDKANLLAAMTAIQTQLQETDGEASLYVADNGVYSEANMRQLNQAGVKWISRVSETLAQAKALLEEGSENWYGSEDGTRHWFSRKITLPQGDERWVVVYSQASVERVRQTMQRQVSKAQTRWEHTCWHFSTRRFACEADAQAALERELKGKPAWLDVQRQIIAHPQYGGKGRPSKEARPTGYQWQLVVSVSVNSLQVVQEVLRKACWIVGTNVLEPAVVSDEALIGTSKDQGGVERGFRFLKDPLFLASSVFVKKPQRIMALSFIMVLCLLVYRLAEFRLRARLAETQQTIPDQVHKPTARPTMRWVFQGFEGIELLHVQTPAATLVLVLRLQPVHRLILHLLGPLYEKIYNPSS